MHPYVDSESGDDHLQHLPEPARKVSRIKPTGRVCSHLQQVLPQLRCYVWKYEGEWNEEKQQRVWRKPALSPGNLHSFKRKGEYWKKNLHRWGTFDEAIHVYEENRTFLQGVGFVIEPERALKIDGVDRHLVFFDIDDCRDPETGKIEDWAVEIIRSLDTYTEVSPSGEGIRVIGYVEEPQKRGCRFYTHDGREFLRERDIPEGKGEEYRRLEIYGGNEGGRQLITFTGRYLEEYDKPIRDVQRWIEEGIPLENTAAEVETIPPEPLDLSSEEVLKIMLSGKDRGLMQRFMDGDESLWGEGAKYRSRNNADLGFFRKLAFYSRADKKQMRKIAFFSKMYREKWNRQDYLDATIDKAVRSCEGNFYNPHYSSQEPEVPDGKRDIPRKRVDLPDEELLEKLEELKGEKFQSLWAGDEGLWEGCSSTYKALEGAQLGLCSMLSFITGNDEERVDKLFRQSGLYQENWEDEDYRARTLQKALSETIYEPGWVPDNKARDASLDTLEGLRLNLAWGTSGGMHACYVYYALIEKGRIDGKLIENLIPEDGIELVSLSDRFPDYEPDIVVRATDRGLMLGSGMYSREAITKGKRLLEEQGLIQTLKKGSDGNPSIYRLKTPKNMPNKIIPYPPGFVGTKRDLDDFIQGMKRVKNHGTKRALHPLKEVDYTKTMKRVPKTPFRSHLNSMACHDRNIKNLVRHTRLGMDHPDGIARVMYEQREEVVEYLNPHPPLALSSPFVEPILHVPVFVSKYPMDRETRRKLIHTESLTPKEKFIIEQVDHGRQSLLELMKFFDMRKDNLKRIINPLMQKGLLVPFKNEYYGECYEKAKNFEQVLDEEYHRSGSEEQYEVIKERNKEEREAYRSKQKQWEENTEKVKEEYKKTGEFIAFLSETDKGGQKEKHG